MSETKYRKGKIKCKKCQEHRNSKHAGKCPNGHGLICYPCANVRGLKQQCPFCNAALLEIGTRRKKGKI